MSNRPRRKKRPDIAIYTPVHRRQEHKQQQQQPVTDDEHQNAHHLNSNGDESEVTERNDESRPQREQRPRGRRPEKGLYIPKAKTSSGSGEGGEGGADSEDAVKVDEKVKVISSPPVAIPSAAEMTIDWAEEVENELYGTPDDTATFLDAYERSGWTDPSIVLNEERQEARSVEREAEKPISIPRPLANTVVFERSKPVNEVKGEWPETDNRSGNQRSHHNRQAQQHDHNSEQGHRQSRPGHQGPHPSHPGHHRNQGPQGHLGNQGGHHGHHSNQASHGHHADHQHSNQQSYVSNLPPRLQAKQQERFARDKSKKGHHGNQAPSHENAVVDDHSSHHGDEHDEELRNVQKSQSGTNRSHSNENNLADDQEHQAEARSNRRRGRVPTKHSNGPESSDDMSDVRSQSSDAGRPLKGRNDLSPHRDTPVSSPAGATRGVGRGRRRPKGADDVSELMKEINLDERKPGVIVVPKDPSLSPSPIGRGRGRARKLYDPDRPKPKLHAQSLQPLHFKEIEQTSPPLPIPPPFQQRVPPVPMMHMQMANMPTMYPPYIMPPPMPERFVTMYDPAAMRPPPPPPPVAVDRRRSEMLRQEVAALEQKLYALTSLRAMPDSNKEMSRCRIEMTMKCEELILNDAESAQRWGIDQILWKAVYYNTLTVYRNLDLDEEENRAGLYSMLDEGIGFYEQLLRKLEHRYDFSLQNYLVTDRPRPEGESRLVKFSLVVAQALMLNLGDLHRYKDDFVLAKSCYEKAQMLMPKNSQSYNRMAVIATSTKKWLDAVYYHMRSLEAGNANPAAREALVSMFEEVRRKAEFERQKAEVASKDERRQRTSQEPARVEVWIAPDGSKTADKSETPSAVYKRFILNYLFAQGKLYSKTGLDDLVDVCGPLYKDLERVLAMEPCPLDQDRLLKLVIINIFMIHHTGPVEGKHPQQKLLRQDYGLVLALDIFAILVQRFLHLLHQHMENSGRYPQVILDERLRAIYPALKVWSDWMTFTQRVWNPPPTEDLGTSHDVWTRLAELGTMVESMDISHVELHSERMDGCDVLVLPEDVVVEGYKPLMGIVRDMAYVQPTCDKDQARDCFRIQKLQYFCEFLSGLVPAVLRFNVEERGYFSAVEHYIYSDGSQSTGTTQSEDESDEDVVLEDDDVDVDGDEHVQQLKARKEQLQKQMSEINRQKSNHQAVLDEERSRGVELEIRPLFLIPDTNCFIDQLHSIVQLLATRRYTIVVPLVVINELDNLSRGQERPAVMKVAQKVVRFLEEEFEVKREPRLKAITSRGTVLETIAYRSETVDDKGNNDDLILACCLHYCNQDRAKDFMPKNPDDPVKLYREVVLLTDDRNLRLKAHTRNVPVKDLASFMDYAGLGDAS